MAPVRGMIGVVACASLLSPAGALGQEVADLDYEHLGFRGFGFDWGQMWPTRIERTGGPSLRIDMGYAGPGLRIVPSIGYFTKPGFAAISTANPSGTVTDSSPRFSFSPLRLHHTIPASDKSATTTPTAFLIGCSLAILGRPK